MNFKKHFIIALFYSILTIGMFFGLQYIFAWTNPTLNLPSGNTSPAINEGTTAQVKEGSLGVLGNFSTPIFYDANDTGYYVDPAGTSKFSTINLGGTSRSSWPMGGSSSVNIYQCPEITYTGGCYGWQNGCEGQTTTIGVCKYCSGGVWTNYSCTYLGKMILE